MRRREWLRLALVSGAAAATRPARARAATAVQSGPAFVAPFPHEEATLAHLQAAMNAGELTSAALTRRYLERIAEIDQAGPTLKAVIELNPEALASAQALDRERKTGGSRGPLHGIPILLKDNLDTRDRMNTTAGSWALLDSTPRQDAFVVAGLRQAGAVLLGKTNLSEWANFRSSRSTSGWSGRGGQTRNPYVLDRNPSGSSSGSAVAVAANLCAVAVGTETDGSILSPASYCGIVGVKPTVGLVSRSGIIPIAHSQDTAGPMARTVADAAVLLSGMAGLDPRDPASAASAGRTERDYTRFLDPNGLAGARLGVARKLFGVQPEAVRLIESALDEMKRLGATVIDPADAAVKWQFEGAEFEVLLYEFKADLNAYLAGLGPRAQIGSLADLIEYNERHAEREMPFFGQETLIKAVLKGPLTEKAYLEALSQCRRASRQEGIDAVMKTHQVEALVAPTTGPAHVTDWVHGDRDTGGSTSPAAVAGYPSITVPAGCVRGLPVGLSFFGTADSEPTLLKLAFAFEQATKARHRPRFLHTLAA